MRLRLRYRLRRILPSGLLQLRLLRNRPCHSWSGLALYALSQIILTSRLLVDNKIYHLWQIARNTWPCIFCSVLLKSLRNVLHLFVSEWIVHPTNPKYQQSFWGHWILEVLISTVNHPSTFLCEQRSCHVGNVTLENMHIRPVAYRIIDESLHTSPRSNVISRVQCRILE